MAAAQPQPVERPTAAFVLSLLAGLGMLIRGGMMHLWDPEGWYGAMHRSMHGGTAPLSLDGVAMGWLWTVPIAGLVLSAAAVGLYARPEARRGWGIAILAASGFGFFSGMGGFLAGILGFVAGALALLSRGEVDAPKASDHGGNGSTRGHYWE